MKNTEFYTVDKEKLFHLINTVIGLYQVIDDISPGRISKSISDSTVIP